MTRKQTTIIITFAVVVLVGVVIGLMVKKNALPGVTENSGGVYTATSSLSGSQGAQVQPTFTNTVPQNTQPTAPASAVNANSSGGAKILTFNISISKTGANPGNINVKIGNSVRILITSVDGDYDWGVPYLSYYQFVKKGGTETVAFNATLAGTYSIECRDHCPTGTKTYGNLIVIP